MIALVQRVSSLPDRPRNTFDASKERGLKIPAEIIVQYLKQEITARETLLLAKINELGQATPKDGCYSSNKWLSGFLRTSPSHCQRLIRKFVDDQFLCEQHQIDRRHLWLWFHPRCPEDLAGPFAGWKRILRPLFVCKEILSAWRANELSTNEVLLLALIDNLCQNQHGYCYATNRTLAKITNRSMQMIKQALKRLMAKDKILSHFNGMNRRLVPWFLPLPIDSNSIEISSDEPLHRVNFSTEKRVSLLHSRGCHGCATIIEEDKENTYEVFLKRKTICNHKSRSATSDPPLGESSSDASRHGELHSSSERRGEDSDAHPDDANAGPPQAASAERSSSRSSQSSLISKPSSETISEPLKSKQGKPLDTAKASSIMFNKKENSKPSSPSGFGLSKKKEKVIYKYTKQDTAWARRLVRILMKHGKSVRMYSVHPSSEAFRLLREDGATPELISAVLKWYDKHFEGPFTPKAYTAIEFREKFNRILTAMDNTPWLSRAQEPTEEAMELAEELLDAYRWPPRAEQNLELWVQANLDSYQIFLRLVLQSKQSSIQNTLAVALEETPTADFLRAWTEIVQNRYNYHDRWKGDLEVCVFRPDHDEFTTFLQWLGCEYDTIQACELELVDAYKDALK